MIWIGWFPLAADVFVCADRKTTQHLAELVT